MSTKILSLSIVCFLCFSFVGFSGEVDSLKTIQKKNKKFLKSYPAYVFIPAGKISTRNFIQILINQQRSRQTKFQKLKKQRLPHFSCTTEKSPISITANFYPITKSRILKYTKLYCLTQPFGGSRSLITTPT